MQSFFDTYKVAPKSDYEFADRLIKLTSGATHIENLRHWKIVEELVKLFFKRFPWEAEEFKKTIPDIRNSRRNKRALSESGEIKYLAALPPRLMLMIRAVFPLQQFDKKFTYKLIKQVPLLKIGEAKE